MYWWSGKFHVETLKPGKKRPLLADSKKSESQQHSLEAEWSEGRETDGGAGIIVPYGLRGI